MIGTVPTDLPAKEFLKKLNPVLSYGPKRDGASHRGSRRSSLCPTNLTKFGLERLRGQISSQFKKRVNPHIIPQGLGQKYSNFSQNWRPGVTPKWGKKSKKLGFFHRFRFIETSTGLRIAPKSLSLVGTVPTDLPVKEFLKKNPTLSLITRRQGCRSVLRQ